MNIDSIQNGVVLDHICAGKSMDIYRDLQLDKLECPVAIIKNARSARMGSKDMIKIDSPMELDLDILGYIDPNITVNMIRDGKRVEFNTGYKKLGGTLKKGWEKTPIKRVENGWKGEFYNNVEYGPYVNFGHRLVRNKVTIGYVPGKFFFNAGVAFMENHLQQYWKEEVEKAKRKFEK